MILNLVVISDFYSCFFWGILFHFLLSFMFIRINLFFICHLYLFLYILSILLPKIGHFIVISWDYRCSLFSRFFNRLFLLPFFRFLFLPFFRLFFRASTLNFFDLFLIHYPYLDFLWVWEILFLAFLKIRDQFVPIFLDNKPNVF